MESVKKIMNKCTESLTVALMDDFKKMMITDDKTLDDNTKNVLGDKVDEYKNHIKESIKNNSKKTKSKAKGTRKSTPYNFYMKEKMAELKVSDATLSNNDKFKKIAAMWKNDKDTYVVPESALNSVATDDLPSESSSESS
jgi:hypothetical protein